MSDLTIEIVILVYSRAHHAIKVFESLIDNSVFSFTVCFDKADSEVVNSEQKKIIYYLDNNPYIKAKKVFFENKMGLANSVINAIKLTLKEHDAIILLEDDCVVRSGGIQYFKDGLRNLNDDKRIRSICGYTYPTPDLEWGSNQELALLMRFSPWGWATWADRWKDYNKDLSNLIDTLDSSGLLIEEFASDLARLCAEREYLNGSKDIWSVSWILQHYLTDTYSVFPRDTFIDNIGMDGTGIHCERTEVFDHSIHRSSLVMRDWKNIEYYPTNEIVIRKFMDVNGKAVY